MNKDKILLIAGDNACYNALNEFAVAFSSALKQRGFESEIIYIDYLTESIVQKLVGFDGRAIVGFQTNLFTLEIKPGVYIGNLISVPMYNYILDSPSTRRQYFEPSIDGLTFCYHDDEYIDFVKDYFSHANVIWHPPGGGVSEMDEISDVFKGNREFDLSFIGAYTDHRKVLEYATTVRPDFAEIMHNYFEYLVSNPRMSVNKAIREFVNIYRLDVTNSDIPILLEILYPAEIAAQSYYRENIIKYIIDNGIRVDVFSESWINAPYKDNPRLFIHKDVAYRDSMDVMRKSRMSLNVFSWHKASMTERIANIMLNGAVCVSDHSSRLDSLFKNDDEIILFDLNDLEVMVRKIEDLLLDDEKRLKIARSGCNNAYANHRWINRVDDLLDWTSKNI